MSSQTSCIVSASYNYRLILKWTLKAKQLKELAEAKSNSSIINSDLYEFKTIKDFSIRLEIGKKSSCYDINIKGSEPWSFSLNYVFLVSKDEMFSLEKSRELSFLHTFQPSSVLDEESVTIHCCVSANYAVSSDQQNEVSKLEGQSMMCVKSMFDATLPSDYTNKMIIDFIQRGDLPSLTVEKAIEIIGETKVHNCEVLKILCLEYLMNSIDATTLRPILNAALDLGLPLLENKCVRLIADGYYGLNDLDEDYECSLDYKPSLNYAGF